MGGGEGPKPENLLVILPFPKPVDTFERIRKNHPQIQITFRRLAFGTFDEGLKEIPKGDVCLSQPMVEFEFDEFRLIGDPLVRALS